jgi:hypothetical protein
MLARKVRERKQTSDGGIPCRESLGRAIFPPFLNGCLISLSLFAKKSAKHVYGLPTDALIVFKREMMQRCYASDLDDVRFRPKHFGTALEAVRIPGGLSKRDLAFCLLKLFTGRVCLVLRDDAPPDCQWEGKERKNDKSEIPEHFEPSVEIIAFDRKDENREPDQEDKQKEDYRLNGIWQISEPFRRSVRRVVVFVVSHAPTPNERWSLAEPPVRASTENTDLATRLVQI